MRDTASANPEAFIMGYTDAWYLINAIYAVLDLDDVKLPDGSAAVRHRGSCRRSSGPLLAAGSGLEGLADLFEADGGEFGNRTTERFARKGVDGVEIDDTVGGDPVTGRSQGQLRGETAAALCERRDHHRANSAGDWIAG